MKKKLLALLLCAVMLVSVGLPVSFAAEADLSANEAASSDVSSSSDEESEDPSQPNIREMTVEEQYAYLLSLEDEALVGAELAKLDEQQQQALIAYAQGQQSGGDNSEENQDDVQFSSAVNFDRVAYFKDALRFAVPMARMRSAATPASLTSDTGNGLELTKKAETAGSGQYRITLEAYTTGTITSGEVQPCDIILVLDQSTSMEEDFSESYYRYDAVYSLNKRSTYYVQDGTSYESVSWCETCSAWTTGCSWFFGHVSGTKYTPKTSADDSTSGHVQFYIRTRVGSMSRLEALQQAAGEFVDQVAEQQGDDRIALVGFGNRARVLTNGTGSDAFWSASARAADLKTRIGQLGNNLESATEHGRGLEAAVNLFNANTDTQRRRIVVLFTDGEPAPSGTDKWSSRVVKQALNQSYILKNTCNAVVYTVSVMPGANAANPASDMDKYMDYISSNYPNAQYTGSNLDDRNNNGNSYYTGSTSEIIAQITSGSKIDTTDRSFYLTAGDIETLSSIFQQIADQTGGATISLGANAVIKDVVSDYFTLPEGADAGSISVTTQDAVFDASGNLSWTASTMTGTPTAMISGNEVRVTNFDFDRNFVAETGRMEGDVTKPGSFHGRKVIITFLVEPKDGFWGGNNVPTNGANSGVYADASSSEAVGNFPVPEVNVPLNLPEPKAADKDIYLMSDTSGITAGTLVSFEVPTGEDAWKAAFVNTNIQFKNSSQQISNTEDTTAEISVTVVPKTGGVGAAGTPVAASGQTQTATANVRVFKPVLVFKDSEAKTGDTGYSYETGNYVKVDWKHGEALADTAKMGPAPELAREYAPQPATAIVGGVINARADVPVKVTVKIGNINVTEYTTFAHENCAVEGCSFNHVTEQFIVHVTTLSLTITKTVQGDNDPDQTYLFHIVGKTGTATEGISLTVAIKGSGSVTVQGLPKGEYTVTEDTSWSWRYTPEGGAAKTVQVTSDGENKVEFVNKKTDNHWLTGEAWAENLFTGKKETA